MNIYIVLIKIWAGLKTGSNSHLGMITNSLGLGGIGNIFSGNLILFCNKYPLIFYKNVK